MNGKLLWQYQSDFMPMAKLIYITQSNVVYSILQISMLYGPNDGKVLACWQNRYWSNSWPMCVQHDIGQFAPITNWYTNNIHLMMIRYWGRDCGMLEGSSLVRPLGIIILAFLQKDFGSLLTSNWTLLTAEKLAGHHIVPYFVHVLTGGHSLENPVMTLWAFDATEVT